MEKYKQYFLPLALVIAYLVAMQVLGPIWSNNNVFQDDFRQSMFWLWTFWDPELFQNDFFVPMYQSHVLRTPLLTLIYKLAPILTDNLIWYTKFLVLIIFLISALAVYKFFERLSSKSYLAIASTLIFSTCFWCTDHLSAAHSRSFIWFGLFTYMYLKIAKKNTSAAIFVFALLFFSPHAFLICLFCEGLYLLFDLWDRVRAKLSPMILNASSYGIVASVIATVVLYKVILKDVQTQGVGIPFTAAELRALPEFNPGGRHPIFGSTLSDGSWWVNEHWGMGIGFLPISKLIIIAAIAIPVYLLLEKFVFKKPIDFLALIKSPLSILFISSTALYFISQLVFPALYLPSRFIAIPWLLVSIVVLILIIDQYLNRFVSYVSTLKPSSSKDKANDFSWVAAALVLLLAFGFWNFSQKIYYTRYVSITPEVRAILEATPKNSLIAGHPLLPDLNSASIASKRKVFVDYERSMAYTKDSLAEVRRRNFVALNLTYAKSREEFLRLAHENGITHFMALYDFYSPQYLSNPRYLEPYNQRLYELVQLQPGEKFFIQSFLETKKLRYAILDINQI